MKISGDFDGGVVRSHSQAQMPREEIIRRLVASWESKITAGRVSLVGQKGKFHILELESRENIKERLEEFCFCTGSPNRLSKIPGD